MLVVFGWAATASETVQWPTQAKISGSRFASAGYYEMNLLAPSPADPMFRIRVTEPVSVTFQLSIEYRDYNVSEKEYHVNARQGKVRQKDSEPQTMDVGVTYATVETTLNGETGPAFMTDEDGIANLDFPPAVWERARSSGIHVELAHQGTKIGDFYLGATEVDNLVIALKQKAKTCLQQGELTEALSLSARALRLVPADAGAHAEHGWALAGLMRNEEAEPELASVVQVAPDPEVSIYFATVLYNLLKFDDAGKIADETMSQHGSDLTPVLKAAALSLRAAWRSHQSDMPHALDDINAAVLLEPREIHYYDQRAKIYDQLNDVALRNHDLATVHAMTAAALLSTGDTDMASFEANLAIELAPTNFADPYLVRGRIHRLRGENQQAEDDYVRAIAIAPQNTTAYFDLGYFYYVNKEFSYAQDELSRALNCDPANQDAMKYRGLAEAAQGNAQAALVDLQNIDDGNDFNVLIGIVEAKISLKDYAGSQTYAQNLCRLAPDNVLSWYEMGKVDFFDGKPDLAIVDLDHALTLEEVSPAFALQGFAKMKSGDCVGALTDFELTALNKNPEWPPFVRLIPEGELETSWGIAAYQSGDFNDALSHFSLAINADSDIAEAYLGRARSREHLNPSNDDLRDVLSDLQAASRINIQYAMDLLGEIDSLQSKLNR